MIVTEQSRGRTDGHTDVSKLQWFDFDILATEP